MFKRIKGWNRRRRLDDLIQELETMPVDAPQPAVDELADRWSQTFPSEPGDRDRERQGLWLKTLGSFQQSRVDLINQLISQLAPVGLTASGLVLDQVQAKWWALDITDKSLRHRYETAERAALDRRKDVIKTRTRRIAGLEMHPTTLTSDAKTASEQLKEGRTFGAGGNLAPLEEAWSDFLGRAHTSALLNLPVDDPNSGIPWSASDVNFQQQHVAPRLKALREARQNLNMLRRVASTFEGPSAAPLQKAMKASQKRLDEAETVITNTAAQHDRVAAAVDALGILIANGVDTTGMPEGALTPIAARTRSADPDDPLGEWWERLQADQQTLRPLLDEQIEVTRRQIATLKERGKDLLGEEPQRYQPSVWRGFPTTATRIKQRAAELESVAGFIGRRSPALVAPADTLLAYPRQAQVTGKALEVLNALEQYGDGDGTDPATLIAAGELMAAERLDTPHRDALLKRYRKARAKLQPQFEDAAVLDELSRLREARALLRRVRRATRSPDKNGIDRADIRRHARNLAPSSADPGGSATRLRRSLEQTLTFLDEELDNRSGSAKRTTEASR